MGNKNTNPPPPPPDERVVYLALKNVFKGTNAEIRRLTPIKKLISKSVKQGCVADLVREHDIDTVCTTARVLLTEEVFGSTLKAKIRFPEIFDVSPAQTAEREASEAEAARDEASTIKDVAQGYQEYLEDVQAPRLAVETESVQPVQRLKPPTQKGTRHIPSLFPVYLPLRTQHRILVKVQTILEDVCFDFAQQNMPDVLEKHGWDCAEAAELNQWAAEFLSRRGEFGDREGDVGKPLNKLFRSVADIRHSAVHRIRVSARGVEQFILDAESLVTLLFLDGEGGSGEGDGELPRRHHHHLEALRRMRRDAQMAIGEFERNKHVLEAQLGETLRRLAAQRAELDRLEEAAVTDMVREDGEYQLFAGSNLERAVASLEDATTAMTAPGGGTENENEGVSDTEDVESTEIYDEASSSRCQSHGTGPEGIQVNGFQIDYKGKDKAM